MKRIKQSKEDRIFDIVNYILLIILFFVFLYPLYFVIIASVSSPTEVWSGNVVLLPKGLNFEGYKQILTHDEIWIGYRNSLFYTVVGTVISLFLTLTAAYPLSRKDFKAGGFLMKIYLVTMFFTGGLIPSYLLIKNLHMMDTVWAVLLPTALSVYNLIVTRTFYQNTIPDGLLDAAQIDGCSNFGFFIKVVMPLSKSIIAVMALFYGVSRWNAFFDALIYIDNRKLYPLQIFLRELLIQAQVSTTMTGGTDLMDAAKKQETAEIIKYGLIIVSSLPMLIMYPFVQKHFVKGVMLGSIKG